MNDRQNVLDNLEINIRWIEDIPAHQFAGWLNVVTAMRDAVALLKEHEAVTPLKKCKGCQWFDYVPPKNGFCPFIDICKKTEGAYYEEDN